MENNTNKEIDNKEIDNKEMKKFRLHFMKLYKLIRANFEFESSVNITLELNYSNMKDIIDRENFFNVALNLLKNIDESSKYLNYVFVEIYEYHLQYSQNNNKNFKITDIDDFLDSINKTNKNNGLIIGSSFGGYLEKQIQNKIGGNVISYCNDKELYFVNYVINFLNGNNNIKYKFSNEEINFKKENCEYIIFGSSEYNSDNLKQNLSKLNKVLIYNLKQNLSNTNKIENNTECQDTDTNKSHTNKPHTKRKKQKN